MSQAWEATNTWTTWTIITCRHGVLYLQQKELCNVCNVKLYYSSLSRSLGDSDRTVDQSQLSGCWEEKHELWRFSFITKQNSFLFLFVFRSPLIDSQCRRCLKWFCALRRPSLSGLASKIIQRLQLKHFTPSNGNICKTQLYLLKF